MQQFEEMSARPAMREMQHIVNRELDRLHMDKRDRDDLIKGQQEQIRILIESAEEERHRLSNNIEYWSNGYAMAYSRWKHSDKVAKQSIFVMYAAIVTAFISIGYAVFVG